MIWVLSCGKSNLQNDGFNYLFFPLLINRKNPGDFSLAISEKEKWDKKTRTRWNRCHDEEILQSETILNCRSVQGAYILFHSWSEMLAAHFWQTANKLWSTLIQSETSGNSLLYNVRLKMEETLSEPTISWKQYSGYNYSLFEMLIYMVSSGVASK